MPQPISFCPVQKFNHSNQPWVDPHAFLQLLGVKNLTPPGSSGFWQIHERAFVGDERLEVLVDRPASCWYKTYSAGLEIALDVFPMGIVFLEPKGKVVFMNRSAAALVAERDGLIASRAGLRAKVQAESDLLAKAILDACSTSVSKGLSAGGTVFVSRRARPPLQIEVSPIRNSAIQASQRISAVGFVSDPLQRRGPPQELLRALYGVTPAECRVAVLLADGHAPRKIATIVGVTDNAVRSQTSFRRLG